MKESGFKKAALGLLGVLLLVVACIFAIAAISPTIGGDWGDALTRASIAVLLFSLGALSYKERSRQAYRVRWSAPNNASPSHGDITTEGRKWWLFIRRSGILGTYSGSTRLISPERYAERLKKRLARS